jgi:hypothetical protein
VKQALMGRMHDAMGGAMAQGALATDRLNAFMADRQGGDG